MSEHSSMFNNLDVGEYAGNSGSLVVDEYSFCDTHKGNNNILKSKLHKDTKSVDNIVKGGIGRFMEPIRGSERDTSEWKQVIPGTAMAKDMIEEMVSRCTVEGGIYPGEEVEHLFRLYEGMLEVKVSKIAEWAGGMIMGLYTKGWLYKGEVIGVYKGRLTNIDGAYVLDLTMSPGARRWVDADLGRGEITTFGRINEDIHGGEYNCELGPDGVMTVRLESGNGITHEVWGEI